MRFLLALGLVLLLTLSNETRAAEPYGGSGGGIAKPPPTSGRDPGSRSPAHDVRPEFTIEGVVSAADGTPVAGAHVKLFAGGALMATANSASDGSFRILELPEWDRDARVDLWVEGPLPDRHVPVDVSLGANPDDPLRSPCQPRVTLRSGSVNVAVRLLTEREMLASLKASGCLKSAASRSVP
ncbi:MAG: carboxypeptidase-like regulatory domain-containing protein [bacterium]